MAKEKRKRDEEHSEQVLQVLGHRLRRRIMRILLLGQHEVISPTEASKLLDAPLSNVSYHFRVLAKNRAVELTKEHPVRGSVKHFYRANQTVAKMPLVAEVLAATGDVD